MSVQQLRIIFESSVYTFTVTNFTDSIIFGRGNYSNYRKSKMEKPLFSKTFSFQIHWLFVSLLLCACVYIEFVCNWFFFYFGWLNATKSLTLTVHRWSALTVVCARTVSGVCVKRAITNWFTRCVYVPICSQRGTSLFCVFLVLPQPKSITIMAVCIAIIGKDVSLSISISLLLW